MSPGVQVDSSPAEPSGNPFMRLAATMLDIESTPISEIKAQKRQVTFLKVTQLATGRAKICILPSDTQPGHSPRPPTTRMPKSQHLRPVPRGAH